VSTGASGVEWTQRHHTALWALRSSPRRDELGEMRLAVWTVRRSGPRSGSGPHLPPAQKKHPSASLEVSSGLPIPFRGPPCMTVPTTDRQPGTRPRTGSRSSNGAGKGAQSMRDCIPVARRTPRMARVGRSERAPTQRCVSATSGIEARRHPPASDRTDNLLFAERNFAAAQADCDTLIAEPAGSAGSVAAQMRCAPRRSS